MISVKDLKEKYPVLSKEEKDKIEEEKYKVQVEKFYKDLEQQIIKEQKDGKFTEVYVDAKTCPVDAYQLKREMKALGYRVAITRAFDSYFREMIPDRITITW